MHEQTAFFEQSRETTTSWVMASQQHPPYYQRQDSTTRFPIFTEDISPLINRAATNVGSASPPLDLQSQHVSSQPDLPRNDSPILQPTAQRVLSPRIPTPQVL